METQQNQSNYAMRGARVMRLSKTQVEQTARYVVKLFGIKRVTQADMGGFIEMLGGYGILIDVIDDEEWFPLVDAVCFNQKILIPNSLYQRICSGEPDAAFIFFHELGHLLIGHKAMLHHSSIPPVEEEDAEWQADTFAEAVLKIMMGSRYRPEQLCLRF